MAFGMLLRWLIVLAAFAAETLATRFRHQRAAEFLDDSSWHGIVLPAVVTESGEFLSHSVHHLFGASPESSAAARSTSATASSRVHKRSSSLEQEGTSLSQTESSFAKHGAVHFRVAINGTDCTLQLEPNRELIAPSLAVERRGAGASSASRSPWQQGNKTRELPFRRPHNCHYRGKIKGHALSLVAVTTCWGLTGVIILNENHYFIEPLDVRDSNATANGEPQRHVIYQVPSSARRKQRDTSVSQPCGVSEHSEASGQRSRQQTESEKPMPTTNRRRRSVSFERYVETLVVVDPMMMAYYKNEDVETYVFTIMNMVSIMYHDASIGNAINIVMVKLILLETDETELLITHHADNTLSSFCNWQLSVNPKDETHPNHHDVAILMTRRNICSKMNEPCSTLGLAQVSGMCQPHRSCNVNEDTGLALAYTIAHEIGHNFGMKHDGQNTECSPVPNDKTFIMAPEFMTEPCNQLVWSNCSRDAITRFLDRGWGDCLNDAPSKPLFDYPGTPPGVMYDADHQCRLQYGFGAEHCDGIEDVCSTLWCRVNNHCLTRLEPAAEGTICDAADNSTGNGSRVPKKWCFSGKCAAIGERPAAMDGAWAAWSAWSECTRTCGGGVSSAERHCNNPAPSHGGRYCLGERRRHRICSTQRCAEEEPSFREVQCTEHNVLPYRGASYEWEPVSSTDNPCQLVCKPVNMYFSVTLREVVVDGTPCRSGTRNMCIAGLCRAIGCDWVIDSDAKEDRCGVCHGDGSTCKTVKNQFKAQEGLGYVEAAVIPEGARNIRIEEVAEANNYLAVRSERGEYYLNGHWFIQWSGDYSAAGTVIHYERNGNKEGITAVGPLREPIHVMLLFQSHNPGVLFEYTVPHENATRRLTFAWKYLDWSHCTVSCGGGIQRSKVVCSEQEAGIVEDIYCTNASKPDDISKMCNMHTCPARWWTGPWQHCSATCGTSGSRRRTVLCVRSLGPDEQMALEYADCEPLPRPLADEPCKHQLPPCPTLPAADDSGYSLTTPKQPGGHTPLIQCSDMCEEQPTSAALRCHKDLGDCLIDVENGKQERRRCSDVNCGAWKVIGWSQCSRTCEGGVQHSLSTCANNRVCSALSRPPPESQHCNTHKCPAATMTIETLLPNQLATGEMDWKQSEQLTTNDDTGNGEPNQIAGSNHWDTPELSPEPPTGSTLLVWGIDVDGGHQQADNNKSNSSDSRFSLPFGTDFLATDGGNNPSLGDMPEDKHVAVSKVSPFEEFSANEVVTLSNALSASTTSIAHSENLASSEVMAGDDLPREATVDTELQAGKGIMADYEISPINDHATHDEVSLIKEHTMQGEVPPTKEHTAHDDILPADVLVAQYYPVGEMEVSANKEVEAQDKFIENAADSNQLSTYDVVTSRSELAAHVRLNELHEDELDFSNDITQAVESLAVGVGHSQLAMKQVKAGGLEDPDYFASVVAIQPAEILTENGDLSSRWNVSEWSRCSATCGNGRQTRTVSCLSTDGEGCSTADAHPKQERPCVSQQCFTWIAGPWSQCSVSCGGGDQMRNVQCVNQLNEQTASECDDTQKPSNRQQCGAEKCISVSAALHEYSEKECKTDKLVVSTCAHLKERGYCSLRYVFKNCCLTCGV